MANHKSSIKRIRQTNARRLRNRYYAKTARNAMKFCALLKTRMRHKLYSLRYALCWISLQKKNVIHKNKAGNLKSKLAKHVNALA